MKTPTALRGIDKPLIFLALTLSAIGVLTIYSASFQSEGIGEHALHFPKKQGIWIAVGLGFLLLTLSVHHRFFLEHASLLYIGMLLLLAGLLLLGTKVQGSTRWYRLGPLRMQPSEFMKPVLILLLARLLGQAGERRYRAAWALLWTALPTGLIMLQPDLGTAMLLWPILISLLFVSGTRRRYLFAWGAAALLAVPLLWFSVLQDYQKMRVHAFIRAMVHEEKLPPTYFQREGYQLYQSKIAIGSGGWTGTGFLQGTQNRMSFVPMSFNDFIFSVIAEEWGFLGGITLLGLYGGLLLCCAATAYQTADPSGRLLVVGVMTMISTQSLFNMAMTMGLAPISGVTLPLISYGGSSLLSTLVGIGWVLNVRLRRVRMLGKDPF
jgi:rod shape determining protein RodA